MVSMKHYLVHCISLLISASLLLSCVPSTSRQQRDCASVVDPKLTTFSFDQVSVQDVQLWLQHKYGLLGKDIRVTRRPQYPQSAYREWQIDWGANDIDYGVAFDGEGQPNATLYVRWQNGAPTVGDVLRCLGKPSLYRAYLDMYPEAVWTQLELWYPNSGLIIGSHVERKTSRIDEATELSRMTYVRPGSESEIISRVWAVQPATETYDRILNSLRPWPGEIKDVTIDMGD